MNIHRRRYTSLPPPRRENQKLTVPTTLRRLAAGALSKYVATYVNEQATNVSRVDRFYPYIQLLVVNENCFQLVICTQNTSVTPSHLMARMFPRKTGPKG